MMDMGQLHHFLGISVTRSANGLFLSQRQYTQDILERAGMSACKPCSTPVDLHSKLSADGPPVDDATQYRSLAGALQYLTFTRPAISDKWHQSRLRTGDRSWRGFVVGIVTARSGGR
jgi:hypothetical protein